MRVRAKFTLHADTVSAGLSVDGALVANNVVTARVPCPEDPGLDCFDFNLPPADPAHVFAITLREEPSGVTTAITVPADATVGSRWHQLAAPGLVGILLLAVMLGRHLKSRDGR